MMMLPDKLLQELIIHCTANDIGMAQLGNDEVTIVIMGQKGLTPDEASIIACHILLTGVLSGGFAEDNKQRSENDGKLPKIKVN